MEVVSTHANVNVAGVGTVDVLGTQNVPTNQNLPPIIQEPSEKDEEDCCAMETDVEAEETANSPQMSEDRIDEDDMRLDNDQMDYDETPTYNDDITSPAINSQVVSGSRKNKRKNFQPRNIVYFDQNSEPSGIPRSEVETSSPLDLSESRSSPVANDTLDVNPHLNALLSRNIPEPIPPPNYSHDNPALKEFAEQTMRRLLGLYGLQRNIQSEHGDDSSNQSLLHGKLLENLSSNGRICSPFTENSNSAASGNSSGDPPTPPRTPQVENQISQSQDSTRSQQRDSSIQSPVTPRILNERNFTALLTLAALQDGQGGRVPMPIHDKSLSVTPTTPTSSGSAPTMVPSSLSMRDHIGKQNVDYTRYVKRYGSAMECGSPSCRDLNHREHFHCLDCKSKIFSKKEEMIRHFKWHKKRDESLQHGFMRYSSTDDCSDRFGDCSHNRKQTHYHCLKDSCDKVYISTSDVQMHANYHRKDSAIMQEGFQRFRASEDCNQLACPFSGQRTTHFHCMRSPCNYTFKNKADMEKHKTYHAKDEQLTKDGFKKFMKQEDCCYEGCKLSKISNHIHCIRSDCNYVLHSSGQIFAHKRKHERQDHERAYRKYKLAQTIMGAPENHPAFSPLLHDALRPLANFPPPVIGQFGDDLDDSLSPLPEGTPSLPGPSQPNSFLMGGLGSGIDNQHPFAKLFSVPPPAAHNIFNSQPIPTSSPSSPVDLSVPINNNEDPDWMKLMQFYDTDDLCVSDCDLRTTEHWHCIECDGIFHTKDNSIEHSKAHEQQKIIVEEYYTKFDVGDRNCLLNCKFQEQPCHYHCNWENCGEEFIISKEKPFQFLEHFKFHDFARRLPSNNHSVPNPLAVSSIDAMFKRKRGRPPKNRIIELPVTSSSETPQAIFTSFKLPKNSPPSNMTMPPLPMHPLLNLTNPSLNPLNHLTHMERRQMEPSTDPPEVNFPLISSQTRNPIMIPLDEPVISNPSQPQVELVDGFYQFDKGSLCCDQLCSSIGKLHYHCSHPRCLYTAISTDDISRHTHEFHGSTDIPDGFIGFGRNVNCRMATCPSNKREDHYHCIKCHQSLLHNEFLSLHAEKHKEKESDGNHSLGPLSPIYLQKQRPESPMDTPLNHSATSSNGSADTPTKSVVKSSGIFYPLSPFPNSTPGKSRNTMSEPGAMIMPIPTSRPISHSTFSLPVSGSLTITATRRSPIHSPTQEIMDHEDCDKQKSSLEIKDETIDEMNTNDLIDDAKVEDSNDKDNDEWSHKSISFGADTCARPFCKLKKKEHHHCHICNQAFSEQDKLEAHIMKHVTGCTSQIAEANLEGDNNNTSSLQSQQSDDKAEPKKEFGSMSPQNIMNSLNNNLPASASLLGASPRLSLSSIVMPQGQHGFHNPLLYSQASGFPSPGLPSPFAPHFGLTGMFHGAVPRLLPPGSWGGVHPALAAMAHPLMIPQIRSNGEISPLPPSSQVGLGTMSSINSSVGSSGITASESSPMLPSALTTSPHLALLGKRMGPEDFSMQDSKKIRCSHSLRLLKDEPVPEGYIRFRFNEDCQYPHCGYREHQTHFHCMRKDCGYSFCDKTRFVQHTARHERLDTLMGGDFHQFRANVPCGRPECAYSSMIGQQQNKASHFHCLKCDFVCTDTNKVVAHRRQHQKRDSINAAGFEKFTPSQPCGVQSCSHNQKQTHYHCLKCQYSVLGLSQMSAHKFRHLE